MLYFNRTGFDIRVNDTAAEKIEMSALDCSLVIADTARLNGFSELNVTELTTGFTVPVLEADPTQNPIPIIQTGDTKIPLDMRKLYKIGVSEPQIEQDLTNHFIALTEGESITEQFAYDGYFREEGGKLFADRRFADMETSFVFSDNMTLYRESVFTKYTCCDIEEEYSSWVHGTVEAGEPAPDELADAFYIKANMIEITGDRDAFEPALSQEITLGHCQVKCHSISYNVIRDTIKIILNKYIEGKITDTTKWLDYLKDALYHGEVTTSQYDIDTENCITAMISIMNDINKSNLTNALICINCLCKDMNNVYFNLRAGCAEWNSSVKNNFDPDGWCYIDENGNVTSSYNGKTDLLSLFKDTAIPNPPNQGFYLLSKADGIRCHYMLELVNGFGNNNIKFTISKRIANSESTSPGKMYIVSSSNKFPVIRSYQSDKVNSKVYYYYGGGWWEF